MWTNRYDSYIRAITKSHYKNNIPKHVRCVLSTPLQASR